MIKRWLAAQRKKHASRLRVAGYEYAAAQLVRHSHNHDAMARIRSEADGAYNLDEDGSFESGMSLAVMAWDNHVQAIFEAGRRKGAEEVLKHGALSHEFHLPLADTHL